MDDGPLFPTQWWWTLLDVAVAAVVASLALQAPTSEPKAMVIGLVMAVVLIERRRRPVLVMGVVSALSVVQLLLVRDLSVHDVAVLVAMAAVVTHGKSMRSAYVAGGVVAVGLLFALLVVGDTIRDAVLFGAVVALCVVVWLVSVVLRLRKDAAAAYADRAATAERERDHLVALAAAAERAAIARELHDIVAHSLAVMIVQADGATYVVDKDPAGARKALRTVADVGRDALEDMHRIVAVLRGGSDEPPPTRRVGLDQLEVLAERARVADVAVELRVTGDSAGIDAAEELTVVRLVQEGLTNVLRHAGPGASVEIAVDLLDDTVEVSVADDGAGRTPVGGTSGGNGLVGMRERVLLHNGRFAAGPRAGSGWRVHAVLPRKANSA
ncbi:sensor histidine kinase [Lentzea sp. NPDC051213]|uniref:sensor histidine kinase n=1 Tax=Lentzea sp. NPDC051213 TaxID=3364126 RepID=UPI00378B29FC